MSDLVVIVSGGSRGLGLATVERLLASGHRVATFSRTPTPAIQQRLADPALAERFSYEPVDICHSDELARYVESVHRRFGRIDAVVNNAGVAYHNVLAMASEEDISRMLDINLKATLLLTKECVRFMLLQNAGHVINITSIVAERGFAGLAAYSASKAGMIAMTRSLARELGERNIRVNAVAPGYLETEMSDALDQTQRDQIIRRTPLGRLGQVADVVPWIDFLLSPASGFVTGQVITVDGGASV